MAISAKTAPMNNPHFIPSCSPVSPMLCANESIRSLPETASVITPTSSGPIDAPRSPPAAIKAYMITPPVGILSDTAMMLPGQSIEAESPVRAHAKRPITAFDESAAVR